MSGGDVAEDFAHLGVADIGADFVAFGLRGHPKAKPAVEEAVPGVINEQAVVGGEVAPVGIELAQDIAAVGGGAFQERGVGPFKIVVFAQGGANVLHVFAGVGQRREMFVGVHPDPEEILAACRGVGRIPCCFDGATRCCIHGCFDKDGANIGTFVYLGVFCLFRDACAVGWVLNT